ncbi:MAG: DUF4382 domain-containing protein [Woeseiaceae bacterium]
MNIRKLFLTARLVSLALVSSFVLVACGGGSANDDASPVTSTPTTGTVGLFFTDLPSDEFSEINLNVTKAVILGGDDSQQVLFEGSEPINLLDLTNFNEPIVFGEVAVGTYTKLRLYIDDLELVPHVGDPIYPALPANGKIDMLDADGFAVLPGRTLLVEIDMDANKSIKITNAGNGKKYNFRPVVKVNFMDGGLDNKLARVEGSVSEIYSGPAGSFLLCDIDSPDNCVKVETDSSSSIFGEDGLGTEFSTLQGGDMVIVIGRYEVEPEIVLNAVVLEIGGTAEQVKGNVVSNPVDNSFLMLANDGSDLVIEQQPGTRYFNDGGEITADAVVLGVDIEVEGVKPPKVNVDDKDLLRAALVFVEADPDEQISGTIIEPLDADDMSFGLTLSIGGDTCVRVAEGADVLLVDDANSTVTLGTFADLALGQSVDVFGESVADSCFEANEVIVEVVAMP